MNLIRFGAFIALALSSLYAAAFSHPQTFFVGPNLSMEEINQVIHQSPDGSTIVFRAGRYIVSSSLLVQGKRGLQLQAEQGALLDAQIQPQSPTLMVEDCSQDGQPCEIRKWNGEPEWIAQGPVHNGFAVLQILDSQNIELSGFSFRNSFPNFISIKGDSQFIRIHDCDFVGGTNAIYATGLNVKEIELSNNFWNQDPSGKVWSSLDWQHVHHGLFNYYNGAFFQSKDVSGDIRIHNNVIKNAYNGIRMKATSVGVGNANVVIKENFFHRIADNVIEPEFYAKDWVITMNRMDGVYAPFSFDSVEGRQIVISSNVVNFRELPRLHVPAEQVSDGLHQGGRLLKLKSDSSLEISIKLLNNLIYTRCEGGDYFGPLTDVDRLPEGIVVVRNHFQPDVALNPSGGGLPIHLIIANWFDLP